MVVNIDNAIEKIRRYENSLRSAGEYKAADVANEIIAGLEVDDVDIEDLLKLLISNRVDMKAKHHAEARVAHYAIMWLTEEVLDDTSRIRHEIRDEIGGDD